MGIKVKAVFQMFCDRTAIDEISGDCSFFCLFIYFPLHLPDINCGEPPAKDPIGTRDFFGNDTFMAEVVYTCGPFASFAVTDEAGGEAIPTDSITVTCQWNKTWDIEVLPPCECKLL